jgi:hypothetical protein
LQNDLRQRIEKTADGFVVANTSIQFSDSEMLEMVDKHPERFSPNVILRPLMQEILLPNVAFIGGGGELAYWLELKKLFDYFTTPFPMLLLRNSFTIIPQQAKELMNSVHLKPADFFLPAHQIQEKWVKEMAQVKMHLISEKNLLADVYKNIQTTVSQIDTTLIKHVESLMVRSEKKIEALEKKMLRAEKRKHELTIRQIEKIKTALYPQNQLQERIENMLPYYALFGKSFFDALLKASKTFDAQFCILEESKSIE